MNVLRVLSQTVEIEPGVIEKGGSDFPHDDRRWVIYLGLVFFMESNLLLWGRGFKSRQRLVLVTWWG